MERVYPKGGWNAKNKIKLPIMEFVDLWLTAVKEGYNYGKVATILGCDIIDVQFAESRIRKQGVNLPKLNLNDDTDDSVVFII
jgi:hypothetical protein